MRALEIARQRAPDVPFVFVSGVMGEDAAVESLRRGATDYVLKTNLARLAPALTRAIEEAGAKSARRKAELRILDLANLYAALSEANATLARAQARDQLFQDMCRIAVTRGGFRFAWVGLIDQASGAILIVPNTPKLGPLRQSAARLTKGKIDFVLFGNTRCIVKSGSKVTVVIGEFKAENLTVE